MNRTAPPPGTIRSAATLINVQRTPLCAGDGKPATGAGGIPQRALLTIRVRSNAEAGPSRAEGAGMGKGTTGDARDYARGWAGPPHRLPAVVWQRCAGCAQEQRTSGMVRGIGADGRRVPLCYTCYERATDGAWHGTDEYWDGGHWVPLSEGA